MAIFLICLLVYLLGWFVSSVYFKWLTTKDWWDVEDAETIIALIWPLSVPYVLIDRLTSWISVKFFRHNIY